MLGSFLGQLCFIQMIDKLVVLKPVGFITASTEYRLGEMFWRNPMQFTLSRYFLWLFIYCITYYTKTSITFLKWKFTNLKICKRYLVALHQPQIYLLTSEVPGTFFGSLLCGFRPHVFSCPYVNSNCHMHAFLYILQSGFLELL